MTALAAALAGVLAALVLLPLLLLAFSAAVGALVNRLSPPRGRFVDIGTARIHYQDRGTGPPLLLVHGLGGQLGNFTYALVERLAADFRVVSFDRPGSGHSTRAVGADAGIVAQADLVAQLITALGLGRPLVVGHSLGGAIALALALNHPGQVRGLALLSPLTQPQPQAPAAFRLLAIRNAHWRRLVGWTVATPLALLNGVRVLRAVFGPDAVPADFATRGGGLLTLRPGNFIHASEDMAGVETDLPKLVPRYANLRQPVSMLYGRGDQILDPQRNGVVFGAQQPALQLTLVDGGHMLPVTAPDVTADFIRRAAARS